MTSKKKNSGLTDELKVENQRLQKENARLKLKLRKAEAMLDLQKKRRRFSATRTRPKGTTREVGG